MSEQIIINSMEDLAPYRIEYGEQTLNGKHRDVLYYFTRGCGGSEVTFNIDLDLLKDDYDVVIFARTIKTSKSIKANYIFCAAIEADEIACDYIQTGKLEARRCVYHKADVGMSISCEDFVKIDRDGQLIKCVEIKSFANNCLYEDKSENKDKYFSKNRADIVIFWGVRDENICLAMRSLDMQFYYYNEYVDKTELYMGDLYIKGVKFITHCKDIFELIKYAKNLTIVAENAMVLNDENELYKAISKFKPKHNINIIVTNELKDCDENNSGFMNEVQKKYTGTNFIIYDKQEVHKCLNPIYKNDIRRDCLEVMFMRYVNMYLIKKANFDELDTFFPFSHNMSEDIVLKDKNDYA